MNRKEKVGNDKYYTAEKITGNPAWPNPKYPDHPWI